LLSGFDRKQQEKMNGEFVSENEFNHNFPNKKVDTIPKARIQAFGKFHFNVGQ